MFCPHTHVCPPIGGAGLALGGNHTPWVPIALGGGMGGTGPPATLAQDFYCPPKVSEMRAPPSVSSPRRAGFVPFPGSSGGAAAQGLPAAPGVPGQPH